MSSLKDDDGYITRRYQKAGTLPKSGTPPAADPTTIFVREKTPEKPASSRAPSANLTPNQGNGKAPGKNAQELQKLRKKLTITHLDLCAAKKYDDAEIVEQAIRRLEKGIDWSVPRVELPVFDGKGNNDNCENCAHHKNTPKVIHLPSVPQVQPQQTNKIGSRPIYLLAMPRGQNKEMVTQEVQFEFVDEKKVSKEMEVQTEEEQVMIPVQAAHQEMGNTGGANEMPPPQEPEDFDLEDDTELKPTENEPEKEPEKDPDPDPDPELPAKKDFKYVDPDEESVRMDKCAIL